MIVSGNGLKQPQLAGTVEELEIAIPDAVINDTYSFALITFDNSSNAAQVSNYGLSTFAPVVTFTPPKANSQLAIGLGIGIGVVGVVFVTIVSVLLLRKCYQSSQTKKTTVIHIQP